MQYFFDYGNKYRHVKNENSKHVTYMDVESLLLFQAQQTHKTKNNGFCQKSWGHCWKVMILQLLGKRKKLEITKSLG